MSFRPINYLALGSPRNPLFGLDVRHLKIPSRRETNVNVITNSFLIYFISSDSFNSSLPCFASPSPTKKIYLLRSLSVMSCEIIRCLFFWGILTNSHTHTWTNTLINCHNKTSEIKLRTINLNSQSVFNVKIVR